MATGPRDDTGWSELFDRGADYGVSVDDVTAVLQRRRTAGPDTADETSTGETETGDDCGDTGGRRERQKRPPQRRRWDRVDGSEPDDEGLAHVVADADVLAADLLVGGPARDALDLVRSHVWVRLVASDALLDDAEAVIAELSESPLASDWRETTESLATTVDHPAGDHPAVASAYHGGARHVLSFDDGLTTAAAGVAIRARVETSVKHPAAFARLFDPASIYQIVVGGTYPGPDCDPRA